MLDDYFDETLEDREKKRTIGIGRLLPIYNRLKNEFPNDIDASIHAYCDGALNLYIDISLVDCETAIESKRTIAFIAKFTRSIMLRHFFPDSGRYSWFAHYTDCDGIGEYTVVIAIRDTINQNCKVTEVKVERIEYKSECED